MRRALVLIVCLTGGCASSSAHIEPAPIPFRDPTTFWVPRHANASDRVCLVKFGAEPDMCRTVDEVRAFLRSVNAAP